MTEVIVEVVGEEVPWPIVAAGLLESQRELEEKWEELRARVRRGPSLWVSKSLLGEIPGVVIGKSGDETFGDD
ncbi:hypothetical protein Tco_1005773, partial [Tanacetum coccineum]